MIQVNLLPWRDERRKFNQVKFIFLMAIAGFVTILFFFLIIIYFHFKVDNYKDSFEYATAAVETIKTRMLDDAKLANDYKLAQTQLKKFSIIKQSSFDTIQLLNDIRSTTPDEIFVSGIVKNKMKILLSGKVKSGDEITSYMNAIGALRLFTQPKLMSFDRSNNDETNGHSSFEIDFEFR